MGLGGIVDNIYEAGKMEWRQQVARNMEKSGLPHWQCKNCKRVYDTEEPRHRVCDECLGK